jgi:hypothetical protein
MSSDDVLGRIMSHEMYIEETNHVKNLSKCITTTRKQEIAFKANKKSKNKQVVVESSSKEEEEEEDSSDIDDEDMALFMKKFKKYVKKMKFAKRDKKLKTTTKKHAINVVSMITLLLIVPLSIGMMMIKRRSTSLTRRTRATSEVISPTRSPMVKLTLDKNVSSMMRAPTLLQASLSFQSSAK